LTLKTAFLCVKYPIIALVNSDEENKIQADEENKTQIDETEITTNENDVEMEE